MPVKDVAAVEHHADAHVLQVLIESFECALVTVQTAVVPVAGNGEADMAVFGVDDGGDILNACQRLDLLAFYFEFALQLFYLRAAVRFLELFQSLLLRHSISFILRASSAEPAQTRLLSRLMNTM